MRDCQRYRRTYKTSLKLRKSSNMCFRSKSSVIVEILRKERSMYCNSSIDHVVALVSANPPNVKAGGNLRKEL